MHNSHNTVNWKQKTKKWLLAVHLNNRGILGAWKQKENLKTCYKVQFPENNTVMSLSKL